jgi:hypothetical protein
MSYNPEFVTTNGKERGPDDMVIVSCGIGPEYQEPLHSTRLHCEKNVPEAWRLFYRDYPTGCPPHEISQYAFKIFALKRAIVSGFRYVLWMDSCFQPIRSIEPLWAEIREHGWYVPKQGDAVLGHWCSDDFLRRTGTERCVAMQIPLVYSGLVGFDMNHRTARIIWENWFRMWELGTFNGCHLNLIGQERRRWGLKWQGHVSDDPCVVGHRHDESALALILHQWGLLPTTRGFLTLESPDGFIGHFVELVCP